MDPPLRPTLSTPSTPYEHYHSWPLAPIELESQAPTPSPARTIPSRSVASTLGPENDRKRLRPGKLTPNEHLILMGHVCEHRGEYNRGKIAFWKTISHLFEEDTSNILFISI